MKIDMKSVNKRQLFMFIGLIMLLVGVAFHKKIYKKNVRKIRKITTKVENLHNEISILQTEIPNLEDISDRLRKNKDTHKILKTKYQKHEEGIFSESDIDVFLHYLTSFEKDSRLDFISIKPVSFRNEQGRGEKKKSPYKEKEYSVKVKGSLATILEYIYYIHNLSVSSSLINANIMLMDDGEKKYLQSSLNLKVLFVDSEGGKERNKFKPKHTDSFQVKLKNNSFLKNAEQVIAVEDDGADKPEDTIDIKIDGIIKMGEESRVIFNKQIYRIGDSIQNTIIIDITDTQIILEGAKGKIIINVEE